jgi:SAM-dependent methyltransferase
MVPLMPEMLFISATNTFFKEGKNTAFGHKSCRVCCTEAFTFAKNQEMVNEWYKEWFDSEYYHKLYFNRDEKEAQTFINNLLQHLQPAPQSRMLDAGCGRGRHARFLASKGYEVTGIDLSFNSIAFAKKFERDNLQFYQQDMRLPSWINYFDYVFSFFTSFGYFHTRREHEDAVRSLVNNLRPGGTLLFDYLNVHYAEEHLVHNEVKTIEETDYEIHRWHDENHFFKRIIVRDRALDNPIAFTEKVAKFNLGDFTDMLSFHRMQVQEVFGDYTLNSYDIKNTPRLIVVAKKHA